MAYLIHALSRHLDWFPLTIASQSDFDRAYAVFALGFFLFARGLGYAVLDALSRARAARHDAGPYRTAATPERSRFGVPASDGRWAEALLRGGTPALAARLLDRAFAEGLLRRQPGGFVTAAARPCEPRVDAWLAKLGAAVTEDELRASAFAYARSLAPSLAEGLLRVGFISTARARIGGAAVMLLCALLLASVGFLRVLRFASVAPVAPHRFDDPIALALATLASGLFLALGLVRAVRTPRGSDALRDD
jgi:hypothetical protein